MRTTVQQLPLFRRLPIPKPPPPPPRMWLPVSWQRAVAALLGLRQLDLHLPQRRAPQNRVKWSLDPSTLPYAVKPSKVIWMIQTAPPPKPLCFDDAKQWGEYLMYLHAEGAQITRRQDTGKHSGHRVVMDVFDVKRIDFCGDCTEARRGTMQGQQRCIVPAGVGS
ncbi:MAG: hypothetical protein Q8N17_26170 [Burkholderiaceae bacterium]|nr:hypothetical protein [Burkholderiaceae bacterium]